VDDSITVADLVERDLTASLNGQLPSYAFVELASLKNALGTVQLNAFPDERHFFVVDSTGRLHTKDIYYWLSLGLYEDSLIPDFVWNSSVPLRVKFVLWLASRHKLQTRANLLRKDIVSDDTYQICSSGPKMTSHILLHCSLFKISGTPWASRSMRTSIASTCTAFLDHTTS
jgi:hypothetical protein